MVFSPTENSISSLPRPVRWSSVLVWSDVAKHYNKCGMSVSLHGSSQHKKIQDLKHPFPHCFPSTVGILLLLHWLYSLLSEITYSLFSEMLNSTRISIFTSNFKKIYRRKETCWIMYLPSTLVANTDWSSNKRLWYWVWCSDNRNSWAW